MREEYTGAGLSAGDTGPLAPAESVCRALAEEDSGPRASLVLLFPMVQARDPQDLDQLNIEDKGEGMIKDVQKVEKEKPVAGLGCVD